MSHMGIAAAAVMMMAGDSAGPLGDFDTGVNGSASAKKRLRPGFEQTEADRQRLHEAAVKRQQKAERRAKSCK